MAITKEKFEALLKLARVVQSGMEDTEERPNVEDGAEIVMSFLDASRINEALDELYDVMGDVCIEPNPECEY